MEWPAKLAGMLRAVALLLLLLVFPAGGRASDFWDEVRLPGLRAHAALMHEVAIALRRDQGHQALELLQRTSSAFVNRADTLLMRGLALSLVGENARAIEALHHAQQVDRRALDDSVLGTRAALVATKAGDFAFASDILTRVVGNLAALPVRRELFSLLGDVLLAQGPARVAEAIVAYREAIRGATTTDVRSVLGLALALSRNAEPAAAHEVMGRITAAARFDVVVSALPLPEVEKAARLALALEAVGDVDGASTQWSRAAAESTWQAHALAEGARMKKLVDSGKRVRKP